MLGRIRTVFALAWVALATLVLGPLQWLSVTTGIIDPDRIPRLWHGIVGKALGFRITVTGEPSAARPLLIVSNHISWTDITVLGSVTEIAFVAKSETAKWPLIGWLTRLQRTIYVEREKRAKSAAQADEIADRLAAGDAIVLFPEGTTGDGNLLLPFNTSLFGAPAKLVRDTKTTVWIQPVAIAYSRLHGLPMGRGKRPVAAWIGEQDLITHIRGLLAHPAIDVEVRFGEPVAFTPEANRKEIARQTEAGVAALFQEALHPLPMAAVAARQKAIKAAS